MNLMQEHGLTFGQGDTLDLCDLLKAMAVRCEGWTILITKYISSSPQIVFKLTRFVAFSLELFEPGRPRLQRLRYLLDDNEYDQACSRRPW